MPFVPLVALLALVAKVTDFLKYLTAGNFNGAVTQLVVWAAGVGTLALGAQTDFASGIGIGDMNLAALNGWSQVFVGMSIASVGSLVVDFKQARDNTDSATKPNLIPGSAGDPVVVD